MGDRTTARRRRAQQRAALDITQTVFIMRSVATAAERAAKLIAVDQFDKEHRHMLGLGLLAAAQVVTGQPAQLDDIAQLENIGRVAVVKHARRR